MKITPLRTKILISTGSYIFLGFFIVISLKYSLFQASIVWFLVTFLLMCIRDILWYTGFSRDAKHRVFDWTLCKQHFRDSTIGVLDLSLLLNRIFLFPILLTGYILLILGKQLDIGGLSDILSTYKFIEYTLLATVALSGLGTIFREEVDQAYERTIISPFRTRGFLIITLICSLLAVTIIYGETVSLGYLAIPISLISGLLIFFIGTLLLEEEDEQDEL